MKKKQTSSAFTSSEGDRLGYNSRHADVGLGPNSRYMGIGLWRNSRHTWTVLELNKEIYIGWTEVN